MTEPVSNEELPEALVAALRANDRPPALVTARTDHAVRAAASAQFAGRREQRPAVAWYAVAASLLVAVMSLQFVGTSDPRDLLYTDVDGSGEINIADVLALAVEHGDALTAEELDAFAMQVVSLGDRS